MQVIELVAVMLHLVTPLGMAPVVGPRVRGTREFMLIAVEIYIAWSYKDLSRSWRKNV